MEFNALTAVIGFLGTLFGFTMTFVSFNRARDKDLKAEERTQAEKDKIEAVENAKISTQLLTISTDVKDIKIEQKADQKARIEQERKIALIDASVRSAHKRINKIEGIANDEQ